MYIAISQNLTKFQNLLKLLNIKPNEVERIGSKFVLKNIDDVSDVNSLPKKKMHWLMGTNLKLKTFLRVKNFSGRKKFCGLNIFEDEKIFESEKIFEGEKIF